MEEDSLMHPHILYDPERDPMLRNAAPRGPIKVNWVGIVNGVVNGLATLFFIYLYRFLVSEDYIPFAFFLVVLSLYLARLGTQEE